MAAVWIDIFHRVPPDVQPLKQNLLGDFLKYVCDHAWVAMQLKGSLEPLLNRLHSGLLD